MIAREDRCTSRELVEFVGDQVADPRAFVERIKEISAHPELEYCDFIYFRDGRIFERHSRPQLASDGVIGRVMSFRDVTEQIGAAEKIAAEKDRLSVTLKAISDAVVATDREGRLLLMNSVAEQMCGVSEESVQGMMIEKIFPLADPTTREKLPQQLDRILNDSALEGSKPALLVNGLG